MDISLPLTLFKPRQTERGEEEEEEEKE